MSQLVEIRPGTDADVIPLCEFLNACTLMHQGVSRSSPADIGARLHLEGADPRLDSFVAVGDGAIVGFAHLWAHGPDEVKLFARTHPDARGRGIGSQLLSLCDRRAAELLPGAQRTTTTWAADASAPALLEAHGYRPIRYFVTMEIGAARSPSRRRSGPRRRARRLSARPDLAGALYAAWKEAFAGHWGRQVESEAEFWTERRDAKNRVRVPIRARALAARSARGEVVGFCLCELRASDAESVGRVAEIGVVPARRGAGLGFALLHDGFRELRGRGAARIVLDVDAENTTSALRLYQSAGMTPRPAFTIWEKPAPQRGGLAPPFHRRDDARPAVHDEISQGKHQVEQLQALIDSSPLALVEFGLDTRIRLWNPAAERIFGWSSEEMLGRGDLPMAPPAKRAESEELFARVRCGRAGLRLRNRASAQGWNARRRLDRGRPGARRSRAAWSATWSRTPTSPNARHKRRRCTV